MLVTMPRLTACRASSLCDHWLIGTASFSGSSQASAMIWQICSGVKVAGAPQRDASLNRSAMPAAAFAAVQRRRQWRTVLRQTPSAAALSVMPLPAAASRMMRARSASRCGVEFLFRRQ